MAQPHHGFELNSPISFHPRPFGLVQDEPARARSGSVDPSKGRAGKLRSSSTASNHSGRGGRGARPSSVPPVRELPAAGASPEARVRPRTEEGGASTAYEATTPPSGGVGDTTRRAAAAAPPLQSPPSPTPSSGANADDLEGQREVYTHASDPYSLSAKLKSPTEITTIRHHLQRKTSSGAASLNPNKDGSRAARAVQNFYEEQNENIERLLKPVAEHRRIAKSEAEAEALQVKIAVNGSFVANILLAALQVYGAASSGSLSLFTTMADAVFDPLSNLMLILTNRAMNRVDGRRFPSGKARIENAGNIVFCFLLTAVSFILFAFSAKELADGYEFETTSLHIPSVVAVGVAFVTKLGLFAYCFALRNKYSQVRILWEDHRNDLIINGTGLLTSIAGSKLRWWIDPMGAIILSVVIATLWLRTAYMEFMLLIGVSADTQMLQLITYISMTHSADITALDTVRAWHSGPRLIVEVDIVMDAEKTLRETHDVAEELQTKLESLPSVERAYVHVDYETSHAPEHFLKKEL